MPNPIATFDTTVRDHCRYVIQLTYFYFPGICFECSARHYQGRDLSRPRANHGLQFHRSCSDWFLQRFTFPSSHPRFHEPGQASYQYHDMHACSTCIPVLHIMSHAGGNHITGLFNVTRHPTWHVCSLAALTPRTPTRGMPEPVAPKTAPSFRTSRPGPWKHVLVAVISRMS